LRELLACLGALSLAERQQVPGLPPARADVFPTALATIIAVAEIGHLAAFRHSLYNLRYGVADELLWNSP
jgi:exopolyphosphatase/guanosine-5'-triphosphate,3'-diphosphate pyrophosphatase